MATFHPISAHTERRILKFSSEPSFLAGLGFNFTHHSIVSSSKSTYLRGKFIHTFDYKMLRSWHFNVHQRTPSCGLPSLGERGLGNAKLISHSARACVCVCSFFLFFVKSLELLFRSLPIHHRPHSGETRGFRG